MSSFVIIIISVNFHFKQLSAKFLPLAISYSCCSIPISSLVTNSLIFINSYHIRAPGNNYSWAPIVSVNDIVNSSGLLSFVLFADDTAYTYIYMFDMIQLISNSNPYLGISGGCMHVV